MCPRWLFSKGCPLRWPSSVNCCHNNALSKPRGKLQCTFCAHTPRPEPLSWIGWPRLGLLALWVHCQLHGRPGWVLYSPLGLFLFHTCLSLISSRRGSGYLGHVLLLEDSSSARGQAWLGRHISSLILLASCWPKQVEPRAWDMGQVKGKECGSREGWRTRNNHLICQRTPRGSLPS